MQKNLDQKQPFRIRKRLHRSERYRIKRQRNKNLKREREELLFKPIFVSVEDMNRFEKKKRNEENKTI